ncbi:hypothetical protein INR49_019943, partial [Caranx melampygus]
MSGPGSESRKQCSVGLSETRSLMATWVLKPRQEVARCIHVLTGVQSSGGEDADGEQEDNLAAGCWKVKPEQSSLIGLQPALVRHHSSLSLSISPISLPAPPGSLSPCPCIILHLLQITHQPQRPSTNPVTMAPTDGNFLWSCPVIGGETSKQRTA